MTVRQIAWILVVTEFGFLAIEKFPILLATEAAAIGVACVVRWNEVKVR